jgi:hypothetical protein
VLETTWHVARLFEDWVLASDLRMDGVLMSWRQPARPPGSASARAIPISIATTMG